MKPSRELDALVAEKVMGYERAMMIAPTGGPAQGCWVRSPDKVFWDRHDSLPHYSTEISAAWDVVEKLTDGDFSLSIERYHELYTEVFLSRKGPDEYRAPAIVAGKTAPHAICLAALKSVGVEL